MNSHDHEAINDVLKHIMNRNSYFRGMFSSLSVLHQTTSAVNIAFK